MALQLSQSLRVKEQGSSDFAERIFKNNTVFVIKCFGNIHTDEIIFHFNCDIMVSVRAGKLFHLSGWELKSEGKWCKMYHMNMKKQG